MKKISEKIYCAFCKIPRKAYTKKHMTLTNVLLSLALSVLIMFSLWQQFNAKVFILFTLCLAVAEAFIQMRWRLSVSCPYCGFDPVLYKRDQKLAASRVQMTLEERKSSVSLMLSSKNPFNNLPTQVKGQSQPFAQRELHERLSDHSNV